MDETPKIAAKLLKVPNVKNGAEYPLKIVNHCMSLLIMFGEFPTSPIDVVSCETKQQERMKNGFTCH